MLIVVTSPLAVRGSGAAKEVANALGALVGSGHPVGVISNHEKPDWFDPVFSGTKVEFHQEVGRQSGDVLARVAARAGLAQHDVLVLAGSIEDVQMGKNGGAVLMGAAWSTDPRVRKLGIEIASVEDLSETVRLSASWPGKWWFSGDSTGYSVRALSDLSTINKPYPQVVFAEQVTAAVKQGGPRLNALLTIAARSLLKDGTAPAKELAFGVYPSSSSRNDDDEVLSDLCHRLRTTVSQVRFASRGEPLFIRHTPSSKRSKGASANRTDPAEQIETIHVNPAYQGKLTGRHVVVLDDCTTYGVSFGVAAALLRRAGAAKVTGLALGKFGNQLQHYTIEVRSDPCKAIPRGGYKVTGKKVFAGKSSNEAQSTLVPVHSGSDRFTRQL